jgi:outer membrane protein assembly factor BamA
MTDLILNVIASAGKAGIQQYLPVFLSVALLSCSTSKYVPDGEYLLNKNTVKVTEKNTVTVDEVSPYIRQRPNKASLLNIKFHLREYSLSGRDTGKWINRKLRQWGEAPVIMDSLSVKYSVQNIQAYLRQRGYYFAEISDSIVHKKKKAEVIYTVKPGLPFRLKNVTCDIRDTVLHRLIVNDSVASLLKPRRRLSSELLDNERDRITSMLRNKGYYAFNKSYISYEADTSNIDMTANLKVSIAQVRVEDEKGNIEYVNHSIYRINKIFVHTNYDATAAMSDSSYMTKFDTLYQHGIHLLYRDVKNVKTGVLSRVSLINEDNIYRESDANQTYTNLSNLNMFKSISIHFHKADREGKYLDCTVLLSPFPSQSYKLDVEVSTNSSDMVGFSPGLHYGHRNIFGGAENFTLDFRGVFQYSFPSASNYQTSQEYNVSSSINLPRFMMPVSIPYFKTQLPHTQFSVSFTYQERPDYTRAMANVRFGYTWKSSPNSSYIFNLAEFSMIKMYNLSQWFYISSLSNPYLANTYADHFILGSTGSYIYNSQQTDARVNVPRRRRSSSHYYRINGDIGGNLLSLFNPLMKTGENSGLREIWDMPYAQYAKADINIVLNNPVQDFSALAWRLYFGIGKAYGNSKSMPFEKMYYAGGANSLRGWQVRAIGPGSVPADSVADIPSQVADMRLEINMEYRFPIVWKIEGGFFVDAGNIWSISPKDSREGAVFSFKRFYKEIAVNTGLGVRLNFGYFVLRLDMGYKVYHPGLPEGSRLILPDRWFEHDNFGLHFGIGYPF